jgi:putative aldouronate transport system substrate-binding protein
LIFNHPNGWPIAQALSSHVLATSGGPFVQAIEYFEQYMAYPEQLQAVSNWAIPDPYRHVLPPITPTPEESQEIARIMTDITTYANEMMVRFILGTEPLSGFDNYINTVRRMGIDRAIAIYDTAVTRYNNR